MTVEFFKLKKPVKIINNVFIEKIREFEQKSGKKHLRILPANFELTDEEVNACGYTRQNCNFMELFYPIKKFTTTDENKKFGRMHNGQEIQFLPYIEKLNVVKDSCKKNETTGDRNKSLAEQTLAIMGKMEDDGAIELFKDQYGISFVRVLINDHLEIHAIQSKQFKLFISKLIWSEKVKAVGNDILQSILNVLDAKASYGDNVKELHNRIAWFEGDLYYDLCNDKWQAIKISKKKWEIINDPPIIFRRFAKNAPQVMPILMEKECVNSLLSKYFPSLLEKVHLISLFNPTIPRPILVLYGQQGSTKSTRCKFIQKIIDPSPVDLLRIPKNEPELAQQLNHNYLVAYDNLTELPDWISNTLCVAVTGGGISKRQLYTDDDDIFYTFKRAIIINGINCVVQKPDLLERSILTELSRPTKRITEKQLWQQFNDDLPSLLDTIFQILSDALSQETQITEFPRMADFAMFGCQIAKAMGYEEKIFLEEYTDNKRIQTKEALYAHILGEPLMKYVTQELTKKAEKINNYEGIIFSLQPAELLKEIAQLAGNATKLKHFPKAPNAFSRSLKGLQHTLNEEGYIIEFDKSGDRTITLSKISPTSTILSVLNNEKIEDIGDKGATDDKMPTSMFLRLTDGKSHMGNCAYCGKDKYLVWQDSSGNHCCHDCFNQETSAMTGGS